MRAHGLVCRQFPQDSAVGKSSFAIDEELN
jgi:hypothetical protein